MSAGDGAMGGNHPDVPVSASCEFCDWESSVAPRIYVIGEFARHLTLCPNHPIREVERQRDHAFELLLRLRAMLSSGRGVRLTTEGPSQARMAALFGAVDEFLGSGVSGTDGETVVGAVQRLRAIAEIIDSSDPPPVDALSRIYDLATWQGGAS